LQEERDRTAGAADEETKNQQQYKFLIIFVKDRKLIVGKTRSKTTIIENGVVQGTVLSVMLFLVAMADIYGWIFFSFSVKLECSTTLKTLESIHHKGIRLALGASAFCKTEKTFSVRL
jgi:hypothetical protein